MLRLCVVARDQCGTFSRKEPDISDQNRDLKKWIMNLHSTGVWDSTPNECLCFAVSAGGIHNQLFEGRRTTVSSASLIKVTWKWNEKHERCVMTWICPTVWTQCSYSWYGKTSSGSWFLYKDAEQSSVFPASNKKTNSLWRGFGKTLLQISSAKSEPQEHHLKTCKRLWVSSNEQQSQGITTSCQ